MLTLKRLKELLHYDPETGIWTWLVNRRRAKKGMIAGSTMHGYRQIVIEYEPYLGHRLAWFYMTGTWPEYEIDHIDRNRSNDRWSNLRQATVKQNQSNKTKPKHNTSGHKGVRWEYNGYRARITVNGKLLHLGTFKTLDKAAEAYLNAAKKYYGEYASAGE